MMKFKKMIVCVLAALLCTTSVFAADNVVRATNTPVAVETTTAPATSLFRAGEVGLSLSTGYDVGHVNSAALFSQQYDVNLSAGAFCFPLKNVGFEANVPFYNNKGVSVDEIQAGMILRTPLSNETPILKNISPYVGLGGVYNWQDVQDWAYIGKVGVEVRVNDRWGVFTEGAYRNYDMDKWGDGAVSVQGGLKFVF